MRVTYPQLAVALPVLIRAQQEWGPWDELDELIAAMTTAARRRGLLPPRVALMDQSDGPLSGPVPDPDSADA